MTENISLPIVERFLSLYCPYPVRVGVNTVETGWYLRNGSINVTDKMFLQHKES